MSDKEQDYLDEELDTELEEKDGVKYETSDAWEFDASAPTLSDDAFDNEEFTVDLDSIKKSEEKEDTIQSDGNQIVIKKDKLQFVPIAIITLAIIVMLSILGYKYYSEPNGREGRFMNPAGTVAMVEGTPVSVGMFNMYFSNVVSTYESYAGQYGLDTSLDYDAQYTTNAEGNQVSFNELFKSETIEGIEQIVASYNLAIENGLELTEDQIKFINDKIETCKVEADAQSIKLDDYISQNYADYCTEETLRAYYEQLILALSYQGYFQSTQTVSDDEIQEYFDSHRDEFSFIDCCCLFVPYDINTPKEEVEKTVKSYMDQITDRDSMVELIPVTCKDLIDEYVPQYQQEYSLTEDEAIAQISEELSESIDTTIDGKNTNYGTEIRQWIFSEDTKIGDKNYYISDEEYNGKGSAYIFLKTEEPYLDETEVYSVRHILITPGDEEEQTQSTEKKEYTEEQWAEAEKKTNAILDEYNHTDKSEASFAKLAEKYSQDPGSTILGGYGLYGGLYEEITKGSMVPEFEDWALDDARKYSDVDIVKTEYGYHIMFFVYKMPKYLADVRMKINEEAVKATTENVEINVNDSVLDKTVDSYYLNHKQSADDMANNYSDYSGE